MQVKTRLRINVVLSATMAFVIVLVLILALIRVNRAVEQTNIAGEIIACAFERNTLRNDYLRTDSERAKKQWFAKEEQMARLLKLASRKFPAAEDKKNLQELIKDNEITGKIFTALVENRKKMQSDPGAAALSLEAENRLVSQLRMRVYDRALHALTLTEGARGRLFSALWLAGGAIIGVTLIAAAAAAGNSWTLYRTITDRIERLREGALVIGGGNLGHRIEIEGEDEFAELSRAFNAMTAKLHASYLQLKGEIVERESAEHELRQSEDALQKLNEELEMRVVQRTEELEVTHVELAAQNAELQEAYHEQEVQSAARIRILEELRQNEQLLIQQSRMAAMGEMLVNISHQWRQPLNLLGVKVQELGLSYKYGGFSEKLLDENIDEAMGIIQSMSRIITDFQDFLLPNQEKISFRVDQVISKTIGLIEGNFQSQGISIEVSSTGDAQIIGYPNEYGQALFNLLMNARDAFLERRVTEARITVHSRLENDRSVVTVADNAGGIKEEIIDKIFDAYFTTKELGKGIGVGLFLSKNIIEKNMGGRLSVRNVDGGAEFKIEV